MIRERAALVSVALFFNYYLKVYDDFIKWQLKDL